MRFWARASDTISIIQHRIKIDWVKISTYGWVLTFINPKYLVANHERTWLWHTGSTTSDVILAMWWCHYWLRHGVGWVASWCRGGGIMVVSSWFWYNMNSWVAVPFIIRRKKCSRNCAGKAYCLGVPQDSWSLKLWVFNLYWWQKHNQMSLL